MSVWWLHRQIAEHDRRIAWLHAAVAARDRQIAELRQDPGLTPGPPAPSPVESPIPLDLRPRDGVTGGTAHDHDFAPPAVLEEELRRRERLIETLDAELARRRETLAWLVRELDRRDATLAVLRGD